MPGYSFDFTPVFSNFGLIVNGLAVTLAITATAAVMALVLGVIICLMRISSSRIISLLASAYIEVFRCTPALVQLIWIFYCLPIFLGIYMRPVPTAILALSLNIAAFNAEAFRAAIQAIPASHRDASTSIGLGRVQTAFLVILPQAAITALPVLIANLIGLLQQSTLVSVVAISDLMYQGRAIATASYRPVETMTVIAVVYLGIAVGISRLAGVVEKRFSHLSR